MIVEVTINGNKYEVSDNNTILEVCQKLNIFIPTLCYFKGFSPTGNCGLCAVEITNIGVVLACKTYVTEGMNIITDSRNSLTLRKFNVERLLKNHTISCFNCNKNGDCKLQEYAYKIYEKTPPTPSQKYQQENKVSKLTEDLFYNSSKCIKCLKCIKFVNKICGYSINSLEELSSISSLGQHDNCLLNILDICPTAAISLGYQLIPQFLCNKIETYDANDIFTLQIECYEYHNKIINVKCVDNFISDQNRKQMLNLPSRYCSDSVYHEVIETLAKNLHSDTHAVNIFVIGDNIDIITFSYLKILAQHVENVKLCFNSGNIPSEYTLGLKRSDILSMDVAFVLGNISNMSKLRLLNQHFDREVISVDFENNTFENLLEQFSSYRNPYLFVYASLWNEIESKSIFDNVNILKSMFEKQYNKTLNIRILPRNLSHMLISREHNHISIDNLFEKFNKHDMLSLCVIGDVNHDLLIPEEVYSVSHSVFPIANAKHIPSKHYLEDEAYYLNAFGEIIQTKAALQTDLKSNREFLFDLMKKFFAELFDDINDQVYKYIKSEFFDKL